MVGGQILNFKKIESVENTENIVVLFDVIGTGSESKDTTQVKGKIPSKVYELLEIGASIWWQSKILMLNLCGVPDCQFEKIGYSGKYTH